MKLRPYQREAVQAIRETWDRGERTALAVMATGLGKTIVFAALGRNLRWEGARRVLVLAHRRELVAQAAAKWALIDDEETVGVYQGARRELHADVIIASIASCYPDVYADAPCPRLPADEPECAPECPTCGGPGSVRKLVRRGRLHELPLDEIDLVIIDEAHHVTGASLYAAVLNAIWEVNPDMVHVGVTATPFRADRKFGWPYGDGACFSMSIRRGIEEGWLSPVRCFRVELDVDLGAVRTSKTTGDFIADDLGDAMDQPNVRAEIVKAWIAQAGPGGAEGGASGRRTAAYCATVAAAQHLTEAFVDAGVRAEWFSGVTHTAERADILRRYAEGAIQVVCTVGTLTEGWDDPATSCILMARPTKSKGLFIQIVGRGTRLLGLSYDESVAAGKADCLVLDCSGASALGLASIADLHRDEPGDDDADGDNDDGADDIDDDAAPAAAPEPRTITVYGHDIREIDIFGGGIHWTRINGVRVAGIDISHTIIVYGAGDAFSAVAANRGAISPIAGPGPELETMTAAERYAAEHGKARFLKPSDWLARKPASEKQRAMVSRMLAWCAKRRMAVSNPPMLARLSMATASAWVGYLLARQAMWNATHGAGRATSAAAGPA